MVEPPDTSSSGDGEHLLDAVHDDPTGVLEQVAHLMARTDIGPEARSVAARAAAMASRELGRGTEGVMHARRATALAKRAGSRSREAEARTTLALCLFEQGRTRPALAELELAAAVAPDPSLARRADAQRALVLERLGRLDEAIDLSRAVLDGDLPELDRARVLNNLAIALTFRGRPHEAVQPLEEALDVLRKLGRPVLVSYAIHNLGFVLTLAGDLPVALARFDEADALAASLGLPLGANLVARTRALLLARLLDEAADAANRAVAALRAEGARADEAEAQVLLAEALLALGDTAGARRLAVASRRRLAAQGRGALAARAGHVSVLARMADGERTRRLLRDLTACADALGAAGLVDDALDAHLASGELGLVLGDTASAEIHLRAAAAARRSVVSSHRARGWLAEGLRRAASHDPRGAERAAAAGIAAVARWQAHAGASDLRAGLASHAAALTDLGLGSLVARGDAPGALRWLSRSRALSLSGGGVRSDPGLADDLRAVRVAAATVQAADAAGEPAAAARVRLAHLEAAARARARHAPGSDTAGRLVAVGPSDLGPDHTAIHYTVVDGWVGAVRVDAHGIHLHPRLLPLADAAQAVERVRFVFRRLGRPGSPAAVHAARTALHHDLGVLDEALVAPLLPAGTTTVTVGPTRTLYALPWAALPSLGRLATSLAVAPTVPAAPVTLAAQPWGAPRSGAIVVAAGPGLEGAEEEARRVAGTHPGATLLVDRAATCDAVLHALDGATVAHLVCHGRLRGDNPLFSALALADGPLHVYDLERIAHPPALVVLSACDVGASAVQAGDELLGAVAALLRAGTRSVVAAPVPVPDHEAVPVMAAFHAALGAGATPAQALAAARASMDPDDPRSMVAATAFVCVSR